MNKPDRSGGEIEDSYPLSPIQQTFLDESLATAWRERVGLMQVVGELPEPLDLAAFEEAWQLVAQRHPILRTRIVWRDCVRPFQEVLREARVPFAAVDWTLLPRPEQERSFAATLFADRQRGLDLEHAPLLRVLAVRLDRAYHRVVVTLHHATFDGRTLLALMQEVFACYAAVCRGEMPDLPAAGRYRTYIEWLAQQDLGQAESFWRQALRGIRVPTALGIARAERLPEASREDAGPPAVWFSHDVAVWLTERDTSALSSFAGSLGLTLNTLLLAAWSLMLSRYGGVRDILFGVVRTHRGPLAAGGPPILGPVMASVPFHAVVDPGAELGSWLRGVRSDWLAMRAGDFAATAQIREWSELDRQAPLFETLVLVETHEITERLRQLGADWRQRSFRFHRQPRVPLSVYGYIEERLQLKVIFDPAVFDLISMRRLLGHLQTALEAMPKLAGPVADLPWLSAAERYQTLVDWNDTADGGACRPVHRSFEEQARKAPDSLAVADANAALTYRQLDESANRLAWLLTARGVRPGALVAVLLERSTAEVETLLGVLKAGAAYLPLEGSAVERLDAILEDADAALLVTHSALRPALRFPGRRILELDRASQELARQPTHPPAGTFLSPEQPAYVIYTSGSTGKPKGVVVPHRGLANLVSWHLRAFAVSAADRASRLAGLGFDASVWELWPYWSAGAAILLPPEEIRASPERLRDWLLEQEVTVAFAPTPLAERLVELSWPRELSLRLLLTGGDALHGAPPGGLPFRLINNYGPTESSVVATSGAVEPTEPAGQGRPPALGRPIGNLRIHLLDADLRPVPIGVRGELTISGFGLAQGYLGRPDLTAASFLPDPHGEAGERLYRTGDVVRYLPTGAVEFLGRKDSQVKLRGFRIEPGEIEVALDQHPAVLGSAIVAREDHETGGKQLVAFLVGRPGRVGGSNELVGFLRRKLPSYMIPAVFTWLDAFPLNASGKVDRKALEAQAAALSGHAQEHVTPSTPLERLIATIWEDVLGCRSVGLHDDFFALGGHSLHVMQTLAAFREIFQRDIPADVVFLASTIARLIKEIFPTEVERGTAEKVAESALRLRDEDSIMGPPVRGLRAHP